MHPDDPPANSMDVCFILAARRAPTDINAHTYKMQK